MNKEEKRSQLEELGVSFAKPKYPSYSILLTRISTFTKWTCSQSKEEMAKAGFFYTGYNDNVRCFFCGNGLGNWETEDDPWVEHAHWFPKCVFLEFCKGKSFIMEVQQVVAQQNNVPLQINTDAVENHASDRRIVCSPSSTDDTIQSMAAVYVIQMGYAEPVVKRAVHHWTLRFGSSKYSTTDLVEIIKDLDNAEMNDVIVSESNTDSGDSNERAQFSTFSNSNSTENSNRSDYNDMTNSDIETDKALSDDDMDIDSQQCDLQSLKNENEQLRDTVTCKVCMEEKVSVIFLPCAHMVTCSQCSPAMKNCPFCRSNIKGTVRAYLV